MTDTDPRPGASEPAGTSSGSKGRPTPKRSEGQRRRTGPVPPPPQTRKEAARRLREQQARERKDTRAGIVRQDERAMLRRDAGPVRSLVRDLVDSRRNVGVLLLPLALLVVVSGFDPRVQQVANGVWGAGVIAMLLDGVLLGVRVRRRVRAVFPDERGTARHIGYALLRSTVFRRFRMPPPKVQVGDAV